MNDDTLRLISDKNVKELKIISKRTLNHDPSRVKNDGLNGFDRLKGLLAEYADNDVDSVKLVRDVRDRRDTYDTPFGTNDETTDTDVSKTTPEL